MVLDFSFSSAGLARKRGRANIKMVNECYDNMASFGDIEYHHEIEIEDLFNLLKNLYLMSLIFKKSTKSF